MRSFRLAAGASAAALLASIAAPAAWAGDLFGRVTDAEGLVSIEGVTVRLDELGRETTTGTDGAYRFTDVEPGTYTLMLSAVGSAPATVRLDVGEADMRQDVAFGAGLPERERIVVVGQRGSLFKALNQKRANTTFTEVISADAIGQFPDENVSEAARRVAGVSVENDQGEGRFVVIRGIDSNLNATNINGVRIPAPENDIRGVALDVIDSEVLEGVIVNKSLTPDQDGDAIGGTIDIRTTTAFDRGDGLAASAEFGGTYNELTEETGPKIAGTVSNIFMDGKFGVALSGSYREREFATENQEVDGQWQVEDGVFWNEEIELRDYIVTRERTNLSANFDYRPNSDNDFYLRTLFSEFSDLEFRRRVEVKLEDAAIAPLGQDSLLFQAGVADGDEVSVIEIDRDSKDRLEEQQIWSIQAGGQSRFDDWTFDYSAAFSHAEEEEPDPGNIDVVTFRGEFEDGAIGLDTSSTINPRFIRDVADAIPIDDASVFEVDEWELIRGVTEDEEVAIQGDVRRDFRMADMDVFVKAGAKFRDREKFFDANIGIYEGPDGFTLADVVQDSPEDFPLDVYGPFPDPGAISTFFFANQGGSIELSEDDSFLASTVEDYEAEEDVIAGYIMGGLERGKLNVVGGVRIEQTDASATALQFIDEEAAAQPTSFSDDYTDVLPSITVKYELTDEILLRAAAYAAIARPVFAAYAPRAEIEEADDGVFEGAGGNPNIERQTATNLDAGVEWYLGNNGLLSAGVFYKDIEDYIAEEVLSGEFFGLTFDEFETFTNLSDAELTGIELSYQQALNMLPAPFDGIVLGANVTFIDSEATYQDRTIDLPKVSDTLANVVLGYDKGPVDVRLSIAHRSEFLDEINGGFDEGIDRFVDERTQVDLTGRFAITDNVRLYAELKNLTDEEFLAFATVEGQKVLLQYEEYGYTANFGVKVSY